MRDKKYLDYSLLLSFQRLIYILLGGRGIGKTYGAKKHIIKQFLKNGSQFVWIRRYKTETQIAKDGFFNKVCSEFSDVKFKVNGNSALINDKIAGAFISLSQQSQNKGLDKLNNVKFIVFDEYVIDTSDIYARYLPNEMRRLFDIYETVCRLNDATIFLLANNVSFYNPAFDYFRIKIKEGKNKYVFDDVYVEFLETSDQLVEDKSNTRVGKLLQKYDADYFRYNVNNNTLENAGELIIDEKPKQLFCRYCFDYNNKKYYIHSGRLNGENIFLISEKGCNTKITFALRKEDITPNNILFERSNDILKTFVTRFRRGKVYYSDKYVKSQLKDILYKLI